MSSVHHSQLSAALKHLRDHVCSISPSLPLSLWLSPTSSTSHLSFSICLSSCNISVWPFHPFSLLCPSHLVWNPPPPFLHFSLTSSWGLSVPPGGSLTVSDLSSRTILCPSLFLLVASWYLCCGSNPSTAQRRDLKENLFSPQRDKSRWRDYNWFAAVITGSFGSAYSVALNCACQSPCFCLGLSVVCQLEKKNRQSGINAGIWVVIISHKDSSEKLLI